MNVDIEKLLQWAYRDELPKRAIVDGALASSWHVAEAGARIDGGDRPQWYASMGTPHPDALAIEDAVNALPSAGPLDWSSAREDILGEFLGCDEARSFTNNQVFNMAGIVATFAGLGRRPAWDCERPVLVRVNGPNGKPAVYGMDKAGRYKLGACCPLRFDPPLRFLASTRAEYAVWRTGLDLVVESLKGRELRDHAVLPSSAPGLPWYVDAVEAPPPRVLKRIDPPVNLPASRVKRRSRQRATVNKVA